MTALDLCEAVAGRLAELWPDRLLYRDFCPADHRRPSGFLYVTKNKSTDVNALLTRWDVALELELFSAADAYDLPSAEALRADQERVTGAFPSPLPVGDRRIPLTAAGDGGEAGSAFVKFSASWVEPRQGPVPGIAPPGGGGGPGGGGQEDPWDPGSVPLMEQFTINSAGAAGSGRKKG